MRPPRLRFTLRRMMVAVAIVAVMTRAATAIWARMTRLNMVCAQSLPVAPDPPEPK